MPDNSIGTKVWKETQNNQANLQQIQPKNGWYEANVLSLAPMAYLRLKMGTAVLPGGCVLLTGGCGMENGYFQRLDTAEIFDPRTGNSSRIANLTTRRTRNVCVALDDGSVLVVGGCTWMLSAHDTCERYDPRTQSFRRLGPTMFHQRSAPQAIKLNDGRVFIAGHHCQPEIYDPFEGPEGFFKITTGVMAQSKGYFELTLLADSRVLITGGETDEGEIVDTVEIFDPASGMITQCPQMNIRRKNHCAVLLDNHSVLISGGTGQDGESLDSAEIFDPHKETFTLLSEKMLTARAKPCGILLPDGNVLVSGESDFLEVYLSEKGVFQSVNAPVVKRFIEWSGKAHSLVRLLDGSILITGGVWGNECNELFVAPGVVPWYAASVAPTANIPVPTAEGTGVRVAGGSVVLLLSGGEMYRYLPAIDAYRTIGRNEGAEKFGKRANAVLINCRNGTVLVAGGTSVSDGRVLDSAIIYDPGTDRYLSIVKMSFAVARPVAINLLDGTILITGTDRRAMVYNPDRESFDQVLPGTIKARAEYAVTLLGDGRVLFTGGNAESILANTEIYDPVSRKFTEFSYLSAPRCRHCQVLLRDGSVLIAGGMGETGQALDTLEITDPMTGQWKVIPVRLPEPVVDGRAILLRNGKVLITGGSSSVSMPKPNTGHFLFDPRSHIVDKIGSVSQLYGRTVVSLKDGRIFIAGGWTENRKEDQAAEVYAPEGKYCTERVADMLFPRQHNLAFCFPSGRLAGKVLVVCGTKKKGLSGPEAEIYDPATNTWRKTGSMKQPKRLCRCWFRPDGKLMIFGGDGPFSLLSSVEVFDPNTETWSYNTDFLSQERGCPVTAELNDGTFVVLGTHPERSDIFDKTGKRIGSLPPYRYGRGLPGLVHWRGDGTPGRDVLLLIGGFHGPVHRVAWCELYNAATDSWKRAADMHFARGHLRNVCVCTTDGKALVTGGWDNNNKTLDTAEYYDRITDTWTMMADKMVEKRGGHIVQLLPDGRYLLLGKGIGAEYYEHATGLFTWAGFVHGPDREQFSHAKLEDGSFLYVGGAGVIAERFVP